MNLTGFETHHFTPPARDEAWRFTNLWDNMPETLKPASALECEADVVIFGATVKINALPAGVVVKIQTPACLEGWSALACLGGKLQLEVEKSPARALKIKVIRSGNSPTDTTLARIHVTVNEGHKLTVEHEIKGQGPGQTLSECSLELKADAMVDHAVSISESEEALGVVGFSSTLADRARLNQTFVARSGKLMRLNVAATLAGTGSHADLASIAKLSSKSQLDLNSTLTHLVGNTTASQLAKNLLDGESKAIFTGRVHIAKDAQQVAAEQLNRNLLLSKKAHAIGQPQLEIFADDVKCSHGSTTGQIEEDATFYLLSRGIKPERAAALLTRAFVDEVIHHAPEELRDFLGANL